jgi:hypothetical protein
VKRQIGWLCPEILTFPKIKEKRGIPASSAVEEVQSGLSHGARLVLEFLKQRGASFFADIVRGTGKLKAEIETALWELVAAGVVTADGFDNLRSLIDPKRRAGQGAGKMIRPRHSTGRWVFVACGRRGRTATRRGSGLLDAAATLWNCDPGLAGAGSELAFMAGVVDGLPAVGGSGRDSGRSVCGWIPRRAVRSTDCRRVCTGHAEFAFERRINHRLGGGSAEPGWNHGSGGESSGNFRQDG